MTYRAGTLKHDQVVTLKSIKGQIIESNIAAALGLEIHHPIMSKLWGPGYQTYRHTDIIYWIELRIHLNEFERFI